MILLDKIYSTEEQRVRADKALKLNGYSDSKLQAASSTKKPTIRIKRLSFPNPNPNNIKLKGASSVREDREKALKALRLNGLA